MGIFSKKPRLEDIIRELGAEELRADDAEFVRPGWSEGMGVQAVARRDGITVERARRPVSHAKWHEIRARASPISHPHAQGIVGFGFELAFPDGGKARLMFTAVGEITAIQVGMLPTNSLHSGLERATRNALEWETFMESKGVAVAGIGPSSVQDRVNLQGDVSVPIPPEVQAVDLERFARYRAVFGESAFRLVAMGANIKPTMAPVAMNAMAWCWSHKDSRGKPTEGGARTEIQELATWTAQRIDPAETSVSLLAELGEHLDRQGYAPHGSTLAWLTFCAALATEGHARGVLGAENYHLLADPFLIGTGAVPADDAEPRDALTVRRMAAGASGE